MAFYAMIYSEEFFSVETESYASRESRMLFASYLAEYEFEPGMNMIVETTTGGETLLLGTASNSKTAEYLFRGYAEIELGFIPRYFHIWKVDPMGPII
jgi:hypothetical protein